MTHTFTSSNIVKDIQKSLECILLDIEKYEDIYKENIKLKKELENKTTQYNIMDKEMTNQRDELNNMSKVSMIQSINKQLEEKNNYIKILESQLDKLRNKNKTEISQESHDSYPEVSQNPSPKVVPSPKVSQDVLREVTFNPEDFDEVNGYELLVYKKNYYLRDLETDELYSIQSNKPDKVVGLINNKGKVKLQ